MARRASTLEPLKIDFETVSPLNLKEVGIYRYAEHPDTNIRCFAAKRGDKQGYWLDPREAPDWVLDALANDNVPLHAHNSTVERLIIARICGPRFGWPVPRNRRWHCSAARARRLALPGALDKLGDALGLREGLTKDKEGKNLINRLSKPIKRSPEGFGYDHDPVKLDRFGQYCLQDVIAEEAAEEHTFPMPPREQEYYWLTERMNDRGVRVDVKLIKRLIWRASTAIEEMNEKLREITRGEVQALTQVAQLKAWVQRETGHELLTLRKEDMEGLVSEASELRLPKYVIRALKIRQEGAKSSVSKLVTILNRVSRDGALRGAFVYHGASTGRYTSIGVQLQNLVRDVLKNFDEEIKDLDNFTLTQISKSIRGCFIPRPGHVFVDADYSAIEARGVAWLADCKKLLQIYLDGGDPYCDIAAVIYGYAVVKGKNDDERWVGKQTILGCGYGMGTSKFALQCEKFGKPVEMDLAEKAVKTYRSEYPEIPQLWRDMERAAIKAVQNPGDTFDIPNGKIAFKVHLGYLQMALPSGRRLFYKKPFLRDKRTPWGDIRPELWFWGVCPKTKQWKPEKTWGGTLTENAVQAFSRDLLFHAMERIEYEFEIPLVLSVHDQIVGEVLEEDGEWAVRMVHRAMTEIEPWAKGLPVEVEPKVVRRFGK